MTPGSNDQSAHPCVVVPELKESLLSVSKLADDGVVYVFDKNQCCVLLFASDHRENHWFCVLKGWTVLL